MCNRLKSKGRKRLRSEMEREEAEEAEEAEYQQEIEPPKKKQKVTLDEEECKDNANIPESLSYLKNYPTEKSWYDLDFTLFDSKLSRLQLRCSCRSGAQLPSCCAHGNSSVWLIYFVLFSDIKEILKQTKRDKKIMENIVDLTSYSAFRRGRKEK